MATIEFTHFTWSAGSGQLMPGESRVFSSPIIAGEGSDVSLSVTAQARRTLGASVTYAVGVRDVTVVLNTPPGGLNLNYRVENTHATQPVDSIRITRCVIF